MPLPHDPDLVTAPNEPQFAAFAHRQDENADPHGELPSTTEGARSANDELHDAGPTRGED